MAEKKDIEFSLTGDIQNHPYVKHLEGLLSELLEKMSDATQKIEELEAEVRRLKKLPKKPKIKPSKLDERPGDKSEGDEKKKRGRNGKSAKKEKLEIHERRKVEAEGVPEGWVFKGYESRVRQGLKFCPNNVEYQLEVWVSPDGSGRMVAKLPKHLEGVHFDSSVNTYVLHQYYYCGVTQNLILSSLRDIGVVISSGQINAILNGGHGVFHDEKEALLEKAKGQGGELRTDDTGSRHLFKPAYCNCINNDLFTYFSTTYSKSRINFLEILRGARQDYCLNKDALRYMEQQGLPPKYYDAFLALLGDGGRFRFAGEAELDAYLSERGFTAKYAVRHIKEALLVGTLVDDGFDPGTVIHSDGAGQFNVFVHSLCWKHAERPLVKIRCHHSLHQQQLDAKMKDFWSLYQSLKEYKDKPTDQQAEALGQQFDRLCAEVEGFAALNRVLRGLKAKKEQLLLVLERPETSLHNNDSERDIREYVKRRKISSGTRSENGRKSKDTFLSLKKTCKKLGISFWEYLNDRLQKLYEIDPLVDIMERKAAAT